MDIEFDKDAEKLISAMILHTGSVNRDFSELINNSIIAAKKSGEWDRLESLYGQNFSEPDFKLINWTKPLDTEVSMSSIHDGKMYVLKDNEMQAIDL